MDVRETRGDARPLAALIGPRVAPAKAAQQKAALRDVTEALNAAGLAARFAAITATHPDLRPFTAAVFAASPFLKDTALADVRRWLDLLEASPDARFEAILRDVAELWRTGREAEVMTGLRRARAEVALLVALADLGGVWSVAEVTARLADFATAAIGAAADFLLADAAASGAITLADPDAPSTRSGWIILGMGKLGAGELNYSSDIDLIVLFDPERARLAEPDEIGTFFVRLTRRLVKMLQERTADGYVFRTDLRLRPDPGSTPLALSTPGAFQYYESSGQNWERAAMIKARPVAGDSSAGAAFLAELTPFIWRKYLDYAAIADIHSIKRQIHDHRGHDSVAIAGHNIKLGRGGIREIEFFVQTQQLIAGGRDADLRGRQTIPMLETLAAKGWIEPAAAVDLTRCYELLRQVEHRLQMIDDAQTHTLPEDEDGIATIARLSGFRSAKAFSTALRSVMETVRDHYIRLFETAPSLSTSTGSLVFTGDDEDPETVATLSALGFANPREVSRTVRGWHFGRYPAMRSSAARERLTEITPALLEAFASSDNADAAFNAFDRLLARLPAGVQLFALLSSNPGLLNLIAMVMGTAPRLGDIVTARPHVLDALLDPAFFGPLPERSVVAARLEAMLAGATALEEVLDRVRIFGKEQAFLIGIRVIAGTVGARAAGFAYADLAELLVSRLLDHVRAAFEATHGRMAGGRIALVAMGKLGGREMTAASDLDLLLLYDFDAREPSSDGERPLMGSQYFARLTQRLIAAISAPTAEGALYDVDFRLRPSGNAGPLATHVEAFTSYQASSAWTWEHMALTRARPIAGDASLMDEARAAVRAVLSRPRDARAITADVLDMRALMQAEKPAEGAWDVKLAPGGLVDIEFIAQHLQLLHGADHPEILDTETEAVLAAASRARLLPPAEAEVLLPALRLYQRLTQIVRLCVGGAFKAEEAPKGLLALLARAAELPDFPTLDAYLRTTEADVRGAFTRLIGTVPRKPRA